MMAALDPVHAALRALLPFEWARYDFMLNSLLVVMLLAPACAALGVKVVNFRMAFFSDAISHSAFTGAVLGFVLVRMLFTEPADIDRWDRILPPVTLVVFGLLVACGITALQRRTDLSTDTVIGVFFATVIAGGLALLHRGGLTRDFQQYLYGSILVTTPTDVVTTAILTAACIVFLTLTFNRLMLIGLNADLAASRGARVHLHDYLFAGILALVVTTAIRTVGILLVTALLVVPAAAARNVARSAGGMLRWAALFGWVSGVAGLIASYYMSISAGAGVILAAAALFACSLAGGPILRRAGAAPPRGGGAS